MKKVAILLGFLAFAAARENPFVLPKEYRSIAPAMSAPAPSEEEGIEELLSKEPSPQRSQTPPPSPKSRELEQVADLGFIAFRSDGKVLRIDTADPLKRAFMIDTPKKAVFDFAKRRSFGSRTIRIERGPFKKAALGAHEEFYRVAIEVEKGCNASIDKKRLLLKCE